MTNVHAELLSDNQITASDASQLDVLYTECFGGIGFTKGTPATLRAVQRNRGVIIAHAASSVRLIDLHTCSVRVAVLGFVCVHPNYRGHQLGHAVVQKLHRSLSMPFMLNCGTPLVRYYQKIGYRVISATASYFRNEHVVVDDDPVLLFPNGHPVSTEMRSGPIYFGEDF